MSSRLQTTVIFDAMSSRRCNARRFMEKLRAKSSLRLDLMWRRRECRPYREGLATW